MPKADRHKEGGLRISIYNEPTGSGIGGSEFLAATLAEALARDHEVNFFHRIPSLTVEKLAANSGTSLDNVRLRYVDKPDAQPQSRRNPLTYYQELQEFQAELSKGYDIFVAIVHDVPPFSHAKKGALIVLFPASTAPYVKPEGGIERVALKRPAKYLYQSWAWKKRMETYQFKTAISDYSRLWARRRWGIDCTIVYPPVNTSFGEADKEKMVLSVGRFALHGHGHRKNQEEMLEVYGRMQRECSLGWKYFCVGGLDVTPAHQAYFEQLSALAAESGAALVANLPRNELTSLYERASIFWHASGYGQNGDPLMVEHFGMSTVEAMAAGCVPVVINKGGQSEIVEHGVSGFVWNTLDELKNYTARLMSDDNLLRQMSAAACARAQVFSREVFLTNFVGRLLCAICVFFVSLWFTLTIC